MATNMFNNRKKQRTKMYTYTYKANFNMLYLKLMDTCCPYYSVCPDGQRYDDVTARCVGKINNKISEKKCACFINAENTLSLITDDNIV